ncbi:MAG: hypothetical protein AVDCRST_MAG06-1610 [uncultured Nocardioides sp.]|uniref:Uncharacterized protein n=1 Tax=uncultured Nocardioides sp. TaxID=198441 RepID=A0A6J4NTM1_9ACTN|nr:MAG: hypothetical protein AVDCRST_MAG06-1610 [uncultured Nocardioides sp.]
MARSCGAPVSGGLHRAFLGPSPAPYACTGPSTIGPQAGAACAGKRGRVHRCPGRPGGWGPRLVARRSRA